MRRRRELRDEIPREYFLTIGRICDFMSVGEFVVIGGSKGIGFGIVQRLVADGHAVTVFSRTADRVVGMPGVTHHVHDVMQDELPEDLLPAVIRGLAYCPGSINLRAFRSLKPETFRADFELNVVGAVRSVQVALPGLKKASSASILLFSTVAVGQGMFAHASIAASKGAIEGLTRSLAAELSPEIRVNCLAPALTNTPMTEKFFAAPDKAKVLGEKYPLGRTGTVDDVSSLAHFLLGANSTWITGQVIGVDGGMSSVRK
jgi:3-oxoacyl-[acyl-carrier protein] reductase